MEKVERRKLKYVVLHSADAHMYVPNLHALETMIPATPNVCIVDA